MPVKIRLTRRGRRKLALYDIVVADVRAPRDGRFIEKLGTYNPGTNPVSVTLNEEKALTWIMNGAQPTDTVRNLLSLKGVMLKKHLQVGVNKGAITQDQADKKFDEWLKKKESVAESTVSGLEQKKAEDRKARLAAEAKVSEARAIAQKEKTMAALAAEEAAKAPAVEESPESAEAPAAEESAEASETPAEASAPEAPAAEAGDATEEKAE